MRRQQNSFWTIEKDSSNLRCSTNPWMSLEEVLIPWKEQSGQNIDVSLHRVSMRESALMSGKNRLIKPNKCRKYGWLKEPLELRMSFMILWRWLCMCLQAQVSEWLIHSRMLLNESQLLTSNPTETHCQLHFRIGLWLQSYLCSISPTNCFLLHFKK